jgi:hypothetical protein
VASRTLTEPLGWNATLIKGDVADEARKLSDDHHLLINGSGELVQALVQHRLIDDDRIWIHPVVREGLFCDGAAIGGLSLREIRRTGTGVVILELDAAGEMGGIRRVSRGRSVSASVRARHHDLEPALSGG